MPTVISAGGGEEQVELERKLIAAALAAEAKRIADAELAAAAASSERRERHERGRVTALSARYGDASKERSCSWRERESFFSFRPS